MTSLRDHCLGGATFAGMAAAATVHGPLYAAQYDRARVPDELAARVAAVPGRWHLLVISEDWCIDSQSSLPVIAALTDGAANLELHIVGRDANPGLMDAYLTNGTSRSIPVIIVLDAEFRAHGWRGPRPAPLQALVVNEWKSLEGRERNREIRRWYAIDKGRTILEEILTLLEDAVVDQPASAVAGA